MPALLTSSISGCTTPKATRNGTCGADRIGYGCTNKASAIANRASCLIFFCRQGSGAGMLSAGTNHMLVKMLVCGSVVL